MLNRKFQPFFNYNNETNKKYKDYIDNCMNELENIVNDEKPNAYDFVYIYSRCVFNFIF